MSKQRTLASEVAFSGVGLHNGAEGRVTLRPGAVDGGYRIRAEGREVAVHPRFTDGSQNRTSIDVDGVAVHTLEHLFAAVYGMGIDNVVVEVEGGEVPGFDGSAKVFADAIAEAGIQEQDAPAPVFTLKRPVTVNFHGSAVTAFPSKNGDFRVTYVLDYPESPLAQGVVEVVINPETVREELLPCRTFVMKAHAEAMLAAGRGQGANTQNTLVLDGETVLENELRLPDECPRHKVLDVLGDLATVGRRMAVHVVAYKSGHALNRELALALLQEIDRAEHPRGLLDIQDIEKRLPHRYPFLLVDRVLEFEPRTRIVAIKNVTRNEPYFNGHFPNQPIMPGVLQIEALAQAGGLCILDDQDSKLAVLMGVNDVKFRRPVLPGDQLRLEVVVERLKGRIGASRARSLIDGEEATSCLIKFALVEREDYT